MKKDQRRNSAPKKYLKLDSRPESMRLLYRVEDRTLGVNAELSFVYKRDADIFVFD
jgi:hypothetical protein